MLVIVLRPQLGRGIVLSFDGVLLHALGHAFCKNASNNRDRVLAFYLCNLRQNSGISNWLAGRAELD